MKNLKKRTEHFYELTMDILFPIRNSIQHIKDMDVDIVYPELLSLLNHSIVKCETNKDYVAKAFVDYMPHLGVPRVHSSVSISHRTLFRKARNTIGASHDHGARP